MRGVVIGGLVAALAIGAFVIGSESGYNVFDKPDGPAEKIGQAVDEGVNDIKRAAEDAAD